jgi:peptidyl-prolyl cis-trans isomerase A (cyclophilin A)
MKIPAIALAILLSAVTAGAETAPVPEVLMDPTALTEQAPDSCRIKFETSKGDFVLALEREWAPIGADRFYNLVVNDYFTDVRFFRNVAGFMVQFGIHGDPAISRVWKEATIADEPVKSSNAKGYITYAKGGPDSRTTQVFINLTDNMRLDQMGFSPFGKVVEGMDVVERLYGGYGDSPQRGGRGPSQMKIVMEGNEYLIRDFPELDYIKKATVLKEEPAAE